MPYLELNNVSVGFGSGTDRSEVLSNISLGVKEGEFVAILGYSGSGKSTLMNLIAGLISPDAGEVLVDGKPVAGPHPDRGLVFQNYSLLPWLSVAGNVGLAVNQLFPTESRRERKARVQQAVDRVNLTPAALKRPGELSGGMRQRNSVARTLSMNPKLLLLDEPLSALDALTRSVIQDQILQIKEEEGQTVILITNDVDEGLYMADRIIPLSIGPGASLGPEVEVKKARPRDRRAITSEPEFLTLRRDVINFLLAEKKRERTSSEPAPVSLPNIRPMDISRHRPSTYRGLRPRRRKKL